MQHQIRVTGLVVFLMMSMAGLTFAQQQLSPFRSIGKQSEVIDISHGKYQEIIEKDSLERIGTVVINRNTRKVEALLEDTILAGTQANNTAQSKFLSVDPISKEYAELSPYQYASNRPIDGIDLDGLEYVQRNIVIDYATKKIIKTNDVWYNPNQHNVHGQLGQGVRYKIMTYDANLRLNRKVEFQFISRNATDPFGLAKLEYGNYMGSTSLYKVSNDGSFTNEYDYSLPAIDAVDNLAKQHDKGYDALKAVGKAGLFDDWGTTPVDEVALKGWIDFRDKYNVGDVDPYNNQRVTGAERSAAWRGKTLFAMVVNDKKNAIAGFMLINYRKEAKTLNSRKNVQFNYDLFIKKYLEQGSDGNWIRKKDMWQKDKEGNWSPVVPSKG